MPPRTSGLLESSLYVQDVARSKRFYEEILGFPLMVSFEPRGCALECGERRVLLLFQQGASRDIVSPHDGTGELHVAFGIEPAELEKWEAWLAQHDIPIEEKTHWERGGVSIYFRDPDRHLLEFATPGTWPSY